MTVLFHCKFEHSLVILMNWFKFVMDSFSLSNCTLCRSCSWHISDPCTCMAQVKSGEEYQYKVARFGLNRVWKFETPTRLVRITLNFLGIFMDFCGFYAPGSNDRGHIVFVLSVCLSVCLFVCLSVCLSVVNFNLRYNIWTVRGRNFIFGMHTNDALSNDLVILNLTFALKIAFWVFVAAGGIFSVSQTHLDF